MPKSPAQLQREIDEALARRGEDPAHRVVFGSPEHNLIRAREVLADGLPHITSPGDALFVAFKKLRSLKEATLTHLSGGDYAVKTTDKSLWETGKRTHSTVKDKTGLKVSEYTKLATATSIPRIEKYINDFSYSTNYRVDPETLQITNPVKAPPENWFVMRYRGGYLFGRKL